MTKAQSEEWTRLDVEYEELEAEFERLVEKQADLSRRLWKWLDATGAPMDRPRSLRPRHGVKAAR